MNVRILSDLHLEFDDDEYDPGTGDVLILAGDICTAVDIYLNNEQGKKYLKFFKRCADQYDKVFYTFGNHESYDFDLAETDIILRQKIDERISILNNQREYYNGWWFVGSTLWTDFGGANPVIMGECSHYMNDYHTIKMNGISLTTDDTLKAHDESVKYLKTILPQCNENTILFTHHAPSMRSVVGLARVTGAEGAYATDLEYLLKENPQVKFAFHGHTHRSENYKVGGCTVISNPRGYVNYSENPGYLKALCFDVDIYTRTAEELAQAVPTTT